VREPFEEVTLDIDNEYQVSFARMHEYLLIVNYLLDFLLQGEMMEMINKRCGEITDIKDIGDRIRMLFKAPSRGMMGFRYEAMNATRGNATVNSTFSHYDIVKMSDFAGLKKGKLVSCETGKSNGYALTAIEERGFLFIGVGEDIYEGMVIGESAKGDNLDVNPCKAKKLSNVRSTGAEEKVSLSPPKRMTIEEVIAYMDEDEVLEVTPKTIRLRKRILDTAERQRYNKRVGRTKG
jgi:GTP-binding protein